MSEKPSKKLTPEPASEKATEAPNNPAPVPELGQDYPYYDALDYWAALAEPHPSLADWEKHLLAARGPESYLSISPFSATEQTQRLESEITELKSAIQKQASELQTAKRGKKQRDEQFEQLRNDFQALRRKQELAFLLDRVTPRAHEALLASEDARGPFFSATQHLAFILAIDIRRSTELMLKAKTPEQFAHFMTELCGALEGLIKDHFGVFDKFTGDGVLAFFPEFFSGADAGFHALSVAHEARSIFERSYRKHRSSFTTVLNEVHLATGIDYGPVHLMQVAGGLTVVGTPVVYACRLSGGPAGKVLLNQPAYDRISDGYSNLWFVRETKLEIKHEGEVLCYELETANRPYVAKPPPWVTRSAEA